MYLLFFFNLSHNNSYAESNISYSYRKGSTTSTKNYSYGTAFKEKTTKGEDIACSSKVNCYIGCSCQSGWTQGSVPTSGEYVWATDNRYTGVNAMSASNVSDATSLTDSKSIQSSSEDTQVISLSGNVSTMSSSGGMTCYKEACPSGYYLDAPNSTYFAVSSTSGTIGLTCYKATGCKEGYAEDGDTSGPGATYHGMKCYQAGCPDGYYEPIEYAPGWDMTKQYMNLEEKNGCYKPISCKSGYLAKSDLKSGYDKYFQLDYSADFGGLSCYTGHCKYSTPNTSYFTTSEFDVGGGIKCKYATGCQSGKFMPSGQKPYRYSTSDDTSGCDTYYDSFTSGNVTCYKNIAYDGIFTITLIIDRYYTGNYTLYSVRSSCPYSTSFYLSFYTGVDNYNATQYNPMQCNVTHSMVKQVNGIQNGYITSVRPHESQTTLGNCGSYSYNFGSAAGGERSYIVKYNYETNDFR